VPRASRRSFNVRQGELWVPWVTIEAAGGNTIYCPAEKVLDVSAYRHAYVLIGLKAVTGSPLVSVITGVDLNSQNSWPILETAGTTPGTAGGIHSWDYPADNAPPGAYLSWKLYGAGSFGGTFRIAVVLL
jgi:hypothetical protein